MAINVFQNQSVLSEDENTCICFSFFFSKCTYCLKSTKCFFMKLKLVKGPFSFQNAFIVYNANHIHASCKCEFLYCKNCYVPYCFVKAYALFKILSIPNQIFNISLKTV